jgi:hypothetical protein
VAEDQSSRRLPYEFAPVPRWLFEYRRDRVVGDKEFALLAALYNLAPIAKLRIGENFSINLDRLREYVDVRSLRRETDRKRSDDAVRKRLERARDRGLLEYTVTGNPTAGYRYSISLPLSKPNLSAKRPISSGVSRPTSPPPEARTSKPDAQTEASVASGLSCGASVQPRPTSDVPRPTSEIGRIRDRDKSCAIGRDEARPSSSDVREKNTNRSEERLHGEASSSRVRAYDGEGTVDDRLFEAAAARDNRRRPWHDLAERHHREAHAAALADLDTHPPGEERDFLYDLVETFNAVRAEPERAA